MSQEAEQLRDWRAWEWRELHAEWFSHALLQARTVNVLKNEGIYTLGEAAGRSDDELLKLPHLGPITLAEIRRIVVDAAQQADLEQTEKPKA